MTARSYTPEDYPVACSWWEAHGWPALAQEVLPKCGVVVMDGETPRALGFLYMSNSNGMAMMEWVVTNPANSAMQSAKALLCFVGAIKVVAKELGYGIIMSFARQESLVRLYEREGFKRTDSNVIHLIYGV